MQGHPHHGEAALRCTDHSGFPQLGALTRITTNPICTGVGHLSQRQFRLCQAETRNGSCHLLAVAPRSVAAEQLSATVLSFQPYLQFPEVEN